MWNGTWVGGDNSAVRLSKDEQVRGNGDVWSRAERGSIFISVS